MINGIQENKLSNISKSGNDKKGIIETFRSHFMRNNENSDDF